jgi:hypothetical protein
MSASHYTLLKHFEPSASESARVPSMRTIQTLTSQGYGVDSLTHNKRYSGVGYFDIPEAYPLNQCQVPVLRSCDGSTTRAIAPGPSTEGYGATKYPYRENYGEESYSRGIGYTSREKCNKHADDEGCEKCGLLFYPKCKSGYKSVGCVLCRPTGEIRKEKQRAYNLCRNLELPFTVVTSLAACKTAEADCLETAYLGAAMGENPALATAGTYLCPWFARACNTAVGTGAHMVAGYVCDAMKPSDS